MNTLITEQITGM